ncbi:MAG: flagellar export chaperone FlgN [Armatimonadota bacterium]
MAPEVFAALRGSLVEKLDGLNRLNDLADRHRDALIAHNVDEIVRLNKLQTDELSQLDRLQRSSSKLMARVAGGVGIAPENTCLSALADHLPEDQRSVLEDLSLQLTEQASRLALSSELNANLSANALEYIRVTLQAVSDQVNDETSSGRSQTVSLVLDTVA